MENSIMFQNGQNMARFPGRPGKSIVEGKEGEKAMGDKDKRDNALKHHRSLFSFPMAKSGEWVLNALPY
jgi:hypothetical protein